MITPEQLSEYRAQNKWSLRQMAAYLDISQSAYRNYENGKRDIPEQVAERVQMAFVNYNGLLGIAVDYLRISFEHRSPKDVIENILGLDMKDFTVGGGNSGMLYRSSLNYSGFNYIRVFSRGDTPEDHGALLQVSGRGCRSLEFIMEQKNTDWRTLLYNAVFNFDGIVTRIDMAINDYVKWFDIEHLIEKAHNGEYTSRFRSDEIIHGNKYSGWTLEFGKRGNVFFRFYEKDKEIATKLGTSMFEYGIKNRYELQVADTRKATTLVNDWIREGKVVESVYGFFNRYLTFYDSVDPDIPEEEWKVWEPWHYFVLKSKEIEFETHAEEISLERTKAWIRRSVAPSLKMISELEGLGEIVEILKEASLSPKHEKIIDIVNEQIRREQEIADDFETWH
ncbi:putative phage replication protein RstA [Weissella oryzae SG25]|uniref:Putative phage replication protein RstA n=1 Tax=Weissella oryzae (strain DSM 25784 / JCM 18191 / LMG 30913 / SG25) TaxID=1329250 RepID=A0A069CSH2_WEIOS|nr:replication initiation factor domain-containing protein [Weissella oryzae]GAK30760.1 putative phage replication protein RstA [Weissella oryzae SG25]